MNTSKDLNESLIFPKGEKIKLPYFTGTAWLESLVPKDSTFNCPIGNVTFEPGARNNWHKHPGRADFAYHRRHWIFSGSGQASTGDPGRGRSKNLPRRETLARCHAG